MGIEIERIKPGHPHQNGRHERMHLTLKKEATRPAALRGRAGFTARGLEFLILTAARTGEVIGARWSEIDADIGKCRSIA